MEPKLSPQLRRREHEESQTPFLIGMVIVFLVLIVVTTARTLGII